MPPKRRKTSTIIGSNTFQIDIQDRKRLLNCEKFIENFSEESVVEKDVNGRLILK